jgi:hypothetical protein
LQLIATITPGAKTVPTGQVTFSLNGKALAPPASVTPITNTVAGVTTTTYVATISTSSLPAGTDSVVASYSGDVNYASSSGTLAVTITPLTFTVSPSTASMSVAAGQTTNIPLQVSSLAGYTGYVTLNCTGLPANTTCGFSPNGFILQANNLITAAQYDINNVVIVPATYGPMSVTLSVITGTTPVVPQPPVGALYIPLLGRKVPVSLAILALSPLTLFLRRRVLKQFRGSLGLLSALLALAGSVTMFSGCGSNLVGLTPGGSYAVTIRAVSTATGYTGAYAPGCSNVPAGSTAITCEQDIKLNLTVTQ